MAVVVASMMVIVLVAVVVLAFVGALHAASTSPRFRAQARRWIFTGAAQWYAARRAVRCKIAPVVVRLEGRLKERAANVPVVEMEKAGQQ